MDVGWLTYNYNMHGNDWGLKYIVGLEEGKKTLTGSGPAAGTRAYFLLQYGVRCAL